VPIYYESNWLLYRPSPAFSVSARMVAFLEETREPGLGLSPKGQRTISPSEGYLEGVQGLIGQN